MASPKMIFASHLGHEVRLGGRLIPRVPHTHLQFRHIMHAAKVAAPPSTMDLTTTSLAAQRNVDMNDTLGDCVIAGRAHRIAMITGAAAALFTYSITQVLAEYERIGGYVPGDANTDQGCDMSVAANDGVKTGYADGSHDVGFVSADGSNQSEVMSAFNVLENGDLGLALPDAWVSPFPSGDDFVWGVAGNPNPENGHCVQIVGYDATKGVRINSWGLFGWITWAALAKYAVPNAGGELLVHANADQIARATQKSPEGYDWPTVLTFFDTTLDGNVPLPVPPSPGPNPTPTPGVLVTLDQAKSWAASGLANGPALMTRHSSAKYAAAGLAASWPKP